MPYKANPNGCMPEVMNFLMEMMLFYDKYHLLPQENRVALNRDFDILLHRLSRTCVVTERDIGSVFRRLEAMKSHFSKWMLDPVNINKTWTLHPEKDFNLLLSKSNIVLARMQHEILTHEITGKAC